jgi:hypothetical protein
VTRIDELRTLAITSNWRTLQSNTNSNGNSIFRNVRLLLVTVNVVRSSLILITLMKEAERSYETSFLTRVTWCNIPEEGILHSHRHENFISYIASWFVCL